MGRYCGPSCKLCRREGVKLFLKGSRCASVKCSLTRRNYAPGQHGALNKKKTSEYGLRLREKQKARRFYGLGEGQFRRFFDIAAKKKGITGLNFLELLEMRLDNVIFLASLGKSRAEARLLVRHNHFLVNNRRVNIPSYLVKINDVIGVSPLSKALFEVPLKEANGLSLKSWIKFNEIDEQFIVLGKPKREEMDVPINEQFVVEYYSQ